MKHCVTILFGKEEVNTYLDKGKLPTLLEGVNLKKFCFETESEIKAFVKALTKLSVG